MIDGTAAVGVALLTASSLVLAAGACRHDLRAGFHPHRVGGTLIGFGGAIASAQVLASRCAHAEASLLGGLSLLVLAPALLAATRDHVLVGIPALALGAVLILVSL